MERRISTCEEKRCMLSWCTKSVLKALGGVEALPKEMFSFEKIEVLETIYSILTMHLLDNVFRQIKKENIIAKVWLKLKSLFMTKFLTNKIYPKEQLFGFKIDSTKSLVNNLGEFNKITISLTNIDEKISYEN